MSDEARSTLATTLSSASYVVREGWKHARGLMMIALATTVVLTITPAGQVWATSWLVRSTTGSHWQLPLLALAVLVGLGQVIGTARNMQHQRIRLRMRAHFQDVLLRAVCRLSPAQIKDSRIAALMEGSRNATFELGELIGASISAVAAIATAALLCITVWSISPLAGLLVVVALLPSLLIFAWEASVMDDAFVDYNTFGRRSEYAAEQLVTARTAAELTALGSGTAVARLADTSRRRADVSMDAMLRKVVRGDALGGLGTALFLAAALWAILAGGAGGPGVAAGVVGVIAGMAATREAGFAFGDVITYAPKVRRYRELTEQIAPPTLDQPSTGHDDVDTVEVDDVTVHYPSMARPALVGATIVARRGEMIALVGANGAGKTTLVNALLGQVPITGGQVRVNGNDASELTLATRRALTGALSQDFGRYEFTVRDVVSLGRVDGLASDDEIWAALQAAHAADFVAELPEGLATQLGEQFEGVGISGGQWQRLALARIHLRQAPIWVLDEPTSAIDSETEERIFAELATGKNDRITIVVSHRAWTLKSMDRIYVLDQGRVVECGRFEELLTAEGTFAELFREQFA